MDTILIVFITALVTYIAFGIMNCKRVKSSAGLFNKAIAAFPNNRNDIVYTVIMTVYMFALAVLLLNDDTLCQISKYICLASLLWPMAYIDYKQMRIPNKLVLVGVGYRLIILIFELIFYRDGLLKILLSEIIAVAVITMFLAICMIAMRESIGMGDLKFLMMMALMLGTNRFLNAMFIVMLIAFFVALYLILIKKKTKKDSFSFGPVIAAGALLSLIIIST